MTPTSTHDRCTLCNTRGMTDEHYNEHGELPEPLEDEQPTDMPATKWLFVILVVVAMIAMAGMAYLYEKG